MTRKSKINREHKATLFALIFSDAGDALSLYNAINGTDYDDPDQLEFNTMENVVYIGMKNDVSFLIGTDMNLYEAQSTWNPNMPLRGLFYLAELYKGYVETNGLDIYSSVQLKLPWPRYVVFYNGLGNQPEVQELRLSASFVGAEDQEKGRAGECTAYRAKECAAEDNAAGRRKSKNDPPALECIAHVVNINHGHNQELMEKCRKLWEYSYLIGAIRRNIAEGRTLESAMDLAVQECIDQGILTEVLVKNRAEVTNMILEEYDEEFHIRCEKELSRAEGRDRTLIAQIVRKLIKGKSPEAIAEDLEEDLPVIQSICEAARGCGPEYDCDQIYQRLMNLRRRSL